MEKEEFVRRLLDDLAFAASFSEDLVRRPRALRGAIKDERVAQKLVEDPVFFSVLMCGDAWLVDRLTISGS